VAARPQKLAQPADLDQVKGSTTCSTR